MGGFRPGAGRALVKRGNGISGTRAGRGNAGNGAASALMATVWQTWHTVQAVSYTHLPLPTSDLV